MQKVKGTFPQPGPFSMDRIKIVFNDGVVPKSLKEMLENKVSMLDLMNLFKAEFLAQHATTILQIRKIDSQKRKQFRKIDDSKKFT